MNKPRVLVLRAPGSNCDEEAKFAFERAGGFAEMVHVNRLRENPDLLKRYQVLVIPGGFTYGDDVGAGKILAIELQYFLGDALREFRDAGKLMLGICNGFQVLLKAGLIMPPDEDGPVATLTHNDSGRFEDRWVWLQANATRCPWFLNGYGSLYLPVAHGEGKFLCREPWILKGLDQTGQICLKYVAPLAVPGRGAGGEGSASSRGQEIAPFPINPNGSQANAAGVCDATGRVLGLMPHPERHVLPTQHPQWTRRGLAPEGDGLRLFRNAVSFFL
jgi:phosphoribosylformylglycinamidine synthase